MTTKLQENYEPSENEEYMNLLQVEYFKCKLISMRAMLQEQAQEKISIVLNDHKDRDKDIVDMASWEYEAGIELETSNRFRKLVEKIDSALKRIESGEYGYCKETGEEIGIARLKIDPLALYCIEEQERQEQLDNLHKT